MFLSFLSLPPASSTLRRCSFRVLLRLFPFAEEECGANDDAEVSGGGDGDVEVMFDVVVGEVMEVRGVNVGIGAGVVIEMLWDDGSAR